MYEIRHLQEVILSIVKDIDELCREHKIQYYLLGGSCIGAIRHKGFIPWDDDLDIIMTRDNYKRFLNVCNEYLDKDKYVLQEGIKDWPMPFSKIRLKGTYLHEPDDEYVSKDIHGIYVDIFPMDNVSDTPLEAKIQYVLAKYHLCYLLSRRKYHSASVKKKLMIAAAFPLRWKFLRNLVSNYVQKFNTQETKSLGFFYGRTRFSTSITPKAIYGNPKYVPFEDIQLPVPEKYHEYLTQLFGDYMKLPPEEQRKGMHLISVDFGQY